MNDTAETPLSPALWGPAKRS